MILGLLATFAVAQVEPTTQFRITSKGWTTVASKGVDASDWQVPSAEDMRRLPHHSTDIHTRPGKALTPVQKKQVIQRRIKALEGRSVRLDEIENKTGDFPRFQTMLTPDGMTAGWTDADNPGICEKQAARVETLLRLSEDEQWVLIKTRKFYKE
jgi:hypothetical protein